MIRAGRNLPDKEFRYLRTVIVTADIHGGLDPKLAQQAFTFPHWSQVTPYTSTCVLAESCVFAKQSVALFHCGPPKVAPLLPKIRGQFAEFLREVSLTRLRILIPDTCVGLRYGRLAYTNNETFPGSRVSSNLAVAAWSLFSAVYQADLPTLLQLRLGHSILSWINILRHSEDKHYKPVTEY